MSRAISHQQHERLTEMRIEISEYISSSKAEEMYRGIGKVQGFLEGLFMAGEIDAKDWKMLEDEAMMDVYFQLNSLKDTHAH
jgi:hypothetical protein